MELPNYIRIRIRSNGRPAAGLMVGLRFRVNHRSDFTTLPQATDHDGELQFDQASLQAAIDNQKRMFPNDFGDLSKHGTGTIDVELLGIRDLEWADKARVIFAERGDYPSGYAESLARARDAVRAATPAEIEFEAQSEPELDFIFHDLIHYTTPLNREEMLLETRIQPDSSAQGT